MAKTQQVPRSIQIRVDGNVRDGGAISKQMRMYRGGIFLDSIYIQFSIMITLDGIDGTLKVGNKTVVVESLKTPSKVSINYCDTENRCKRQEVYPCIFYRPEDLIDTTSETYVLSNNEHNLKHHTSDSTRGKVKSRMRRSISYTDCSLHLVSDQRFYRNYGSSDVITTVSKLIYFVTEANTAFRNTDFDGDGSSDNIGFFVSKITVYTDKTDPNYILMFDSQPSAGTYLKTFAKYDFTDVCVGIGFTFMDWNGPLGVAYRASSDPVASDTGICARRKYYSDGYRWLKTAVCTVVTRGTQVPIHRTVFTVAHELGHSFGSPHDATNDPICVPNDAVNGNYLMYSGRGYHPLQANDMVFSPCSIGFMFPVITNKGTCLTQSTELCGNGIKEAHEECDCGSSSICDLIDPSCTPGDVDESNPDPPCTVRRNGEAPAAPPPSTTTTTSPPPTTTSLPPTTTSPPPTTTSPPPTTTSPPPTTTSPPPTTTSPPPTTTSPPPTTTSPPPTTTSPPPTTTSPPPTTTSPPPTTTSQQTSATSTSLSSTSPTSHQSSTTSLMTSSTRRPCQCSIVYAPCCTNDCQFAPSWKPCRNAGECVKPTNCSGTSGECPQIIFEPDKKLCNSNRNTCLNGKCVASVCSIWDSTECECDPGAFECHVCCLNATDQCIPAIINNTYIPKRIGSPCFQRQGFCDHRAICNLVDPVEDYVWVDEVFSPKAINEVGTWMQFYWYYVLAGIVGLSLLAAVFYATFRQKLDVQSHAYMYGQFMKIKYEAEIQKKYIEASKKSTQSEYERKMENPLQESKQMGLNKALSRMKELFPTIADQELEKVLKICSNEEMAVYLILMKGFPLRRIDGLEMSD